MVVLPQEVPPLRLFTSGQLDMMDFSQDLFFTNVKWYSIDCTPMPTESEKNTKEGGGGELCILILFCIFETRFRIWTSSESKHKVSLWNDKQSEAGSKSTHKDYSGSSHKLRVVQSPCSTRYFSL